MSHPGPLSSPTVTDQPVGPVGDPRVHLARGYSMSLRVTAIVIGAGHAGVQAAESLLNEGYEGGVVLLEKAPHLPYQRPPLSKDYMKDGGDPSPLPLRGEAFYADLGIDLRLGAEVTSVDAGRKQVVLAGGEKLDYDEVVEKLEVDGVKKFEDSWEELLGKLQASLDAARKDVR